MSGGTSSGGAGTPRGAPRDHGGPEGTPSAPARPGGEDRFFVTVIAEGREALTALRQHDLDLFKPTARGAGPDEPDAFRVDGLLTLEEVGRLVAAGYRVLVREDATRNARGRIAQRTAAGGAVGFEEWLKGVQDDRT